VALVRPEALQVLPDERGDAQVVSVAFLGSISRVYCRLRDGEQVVAQVSSAAGARLSPQDRVVLSVQDHPVLVVEE
jgi:putative spermidine/putrescine transport system ATP-binding protein